MNKFYVWTILMSLTAATAASFIFQKYGQAETQTKAQVQTHSFPSVETFSLASGRIGFFDRATGKLFIYNDNFDNCLYIGQMTELGQPFINEKSDLSTDIIRYDRNKKDLLKYKQPTQ